MLSCVGVFCWFLFRPGAHIRQPAVRPCVHLRRREARLRQRPFGDPLRLVQPHPGPVGVHPVPQEPAGEGLREAEADRGPGEEGRPGGLRSARQAVRPQRRDQLRVVITHGAHREKPAGTTARRRPTTGGGSFADFTARQAWDYDTAPGRLPPVRRGAVRRGRGGWRGGGGGGGGGGCCFLLHAARRTRRRRTLPPPRSPPSEARRGGRWTSSPAPSAPPAPPPCPPNAFDAFTWWPRHVSPLAVTVNKRVLKCCEKS